MPPPMPCAIAGIAQPIRIASANNFNLILAPSLSVAGIRTVERRVAMYTPHKVLGFTRFWDPRSRTNVQFIGMPEEGVEPSRPCGHGILSPARLPVSPL